MIMWKGKGLFETASNVNNSEQAILIIHHYEDVIKTWNIKSIGYIGKQG